MHPEEREVIDESIVKIRAGRITRRTFLERVMAVGLSSGAAISLLEACGGSSNATGGNGASASLVWQSEQDPTPTYKSLTDSFNNTTGKKDGIYVTWKQGPSSTNDLLTLYTNTLRARSNTLDIMSIDIVYPAQFAASSWIKEITEAQWPASERAKYLQGPIQGCTFNGKIYAAPFRTDIGLLYYRKDLNNNAPATWQELTSSAKEVAPSRTKYGYVWQGAQYEGLVCNFVEVLHGFGGAVLDTSDPTKVTVNTPQALEALTLMVSWVDTISPLAVTTYMEDPSRLIWQNGDAGFMRNWPYAYALSNDSSQSKVADKFDIVSVPHGGNQPNGHGAIGGWNMAINAYSQHPDQAWEFIKFMLAEEAQKTTAIDASLTVTLQSIYDDKDVLNKQPLFGKLKPILQNGLPRPVSPKYTEVSDAIQRNVYQALKKQAGPEQALSTLESDLKKIVSG